MDFITDSLIRPAAFGIAHCVNTVMPVSEEVRVDRVVLMSDIWISLSFLV